MRRASGKGYPGNRRPCATIHAPPSARQHASPIFNGPLCRGHHLRVTTPPLAARNQEPGSQEPGSQEPHGGYDHDGKPHGGYDKDGKPHGGYGKDGKPHGGYDHDGKPHGGYDHDGKPYGGYDHDGKPYGGYGKDGKPHGGCDGAYCPGGAKPTGTGAYKPGPTKGAPVTAGAAGVEVRAAFGLLAVVAAVVAEL